MNDDERQFLLHLTMCGYLGTKCPFCGEEFKTLDDLQDTLWANGPAHEKCFYDNTTPAISIGDYLKYGCPMCGSAGVLIGCQSGDSILCECSYCSSEFILLLNGATVSTIGASLFDEEFYPQLRKHPRRNIGG